MLGVEPALRGNRAVNTKANHTAGEHRDAGDDVQLDAAENLVDINLRRYGNGPADKAGDPEQVDQRPHRAPHRPEVRNGKHGSELATKIGWKVIGGQIALGLSQVFLDLDPIAKAQVVIVFDALALV